MAGTIARRREDARVPALAMANRFSRYKPEEEKVVRPNEVVEDQTLRQLKEAWKACNYLVKSVHDYPGIFETVKKIECSAKDIEGFSLALGEFQGEEQFGTKAGIFLSALINNSKDTDFVIHTNHLAKVVVCLGYINTKNITVKGNTSVVGSHMKGGTIVVEGNDGYAGGWDMEGGAIIVKGDAGRDIGRSMKGGSITVEGNADEDAGQEMEGGTITVKGKAGDSAGQKMKGGTIIVKGKAGEMIGHGMEGGEIHLKGAYVYHGYVVHGKIFHKGKLIVDK